MQKAKQCHHIQATTATFDVNLLYPGASAQYLVTVANQGSIDAK